MTETQLQPVLTLDQVNDLIVQATAENDKVYLELCRSNRMYGPRGERGVGPEISSINEGLNVLSGIVLQTSQLRTELNRGLVFREFLGRQMTVQQERDQRVSDDIRALAINNNFTIKQG